MKMRLLCAVTLLGSALLPMGAGAQEAVVPETAQGASTRSWVDLQTNNNASLATERPMPGEVAEQVYARYLKSFTHPIPEQFQRENFVSGGGGSSGGGSQ